MPNTPLRLLAATCLASFFAATGINAQGVRHARFSHFDSHSGLVTNTINALAADGNGFLWAATDFGLARFDGQRFTLVSRATYPAMPGESLRGVACIGNSLIAAGGYNGTLLTFNTTADEVTDQMPPDTLRHYYISYPFFCNTGGNIYALSTGNGPYRYDTGSRKFVTATGVASDMGQTQLSALYVDHKGRYWGGEIDKMTVFSPSGEKIYQFRSPSRSIGAVYGLTELKPGIVAMHSFCDELWIFDTTTDSIKAPRLVKLPFENVRQMLHHTDGNYYFATDGAGLWYSPNPAAPSPVFVRLVPTGATAIQFSKIYALASDSTGTLWAGTQNSGIWGYNPANQNGTFFSADMGLEDMLCTSFLQDERGDYYIGTDGNGLYHATADFQSITRLPATASNITSLAWWQGKIAISTWGKGILYYNPKTRTTTAETFEGIAHPVNNFFHIKQMQNGELWASSGSGGLYIRLKSGKWIVYSLTEGEYTEATNRWVYQTAEAPDNTFYILTNNTLWRNYQNRLTALTPNMETQRSHTPVRLNQIATLRSGDVLVATTKGILHIGPHATSCDTLDFVPRESYSAIYADSVGYVYAAGMGGIVQFSFNEKQSRRLPGDFSNKARFLFTPRACYAGRDGRVFMGTNSGFFTFHPSLNATADLSIGYLRFSALYIGGEKVPPGQGVLSDGSLSAGGTVTLRHNQTNVSIAFDLIDYSEINQAQCSYRLTQHGEKQTARWMPVHGRQIDFNYLPGGKYTLELKAERPNVHGSAKVIEMEIEVLKPWWKTWWFALVVSLLTAAWAYTLFRIRTFRLVRAKQQLTQRVNEKTAELRTALADKNRLLGVVAHDLTGPVFSIVMALDDLAAKATDEEARTGLKKACDKATLLQAEMQKMTEWARASGDTVGVAWKPEEIDLERVVRTTIALARERAEALGVTLTGQFEIAHCATADSRSVETVMRNLAENAMVQTAEGGTVAISVKEADGMAAVTVTATGGRPHAPQGGSNMAMDISKAYVARNGGQLASGVAPGGGTLVTFTLPLSQKGVAAGNSPAAAAGDDIQPDLDLLADNSVLLCTADDVLESSMTSRLMPHMRVETAGSGDKATEMALELQPDVIIYDPSNDGPFAGDFVAALRADSRTAHIPVLMLTSESSTRQRLGALMSGATSTLAKPITITELQLSLAGILRLRRQMQMQMLQQSIDSDDKAQGGGGNMQPKEDMGGAQGDAHRAAKKDGQEKAPEAGGQMNPVLEKFVAILEKNYTDSRLSVETLASEMCLSQSTLNRRLKSIAGKTAVDLLTSYRMGKAQHMLRQDKSRSIADVAFAVGYTDPSYFTRKFRESFGYPPSQLRGGDEEEHLS